MDPTKAQQQVLTKSVKDPAFRAALLKDATSALEKELGVKAPAGMTVKAHEDTASVIHLVLPPAPAKGALSDADLSKVAGGTDTCGASTNGGGDIPPSQQCWNNTRP